MGEPADNWGEHLIIKHRSDKERRKAAVSKGVFQEKRRQVTSTNLMEGDCSERGWEYKEEYKEGWAVPLREEEETEIREEEETGMESLGRVEGLLAFRDGRRRKMGRKGAG